MTIKTKRKLVNYAMMVVLLALYITPNINIHVHIALAVLFVALVVVHLFLNRSWITCTLRKVRSRSLNKKAPLVIALVLLVVFVVTVVSGFYAMPHMGLHARHSMTPRLHSGIAPLCLIPVLIHVIKHWAVLFGSKERRTPKADSETE